MAEVNWDILYIMKQDYQTIEFKNPREWRGWLDAHHALVEGIWLRMNNKDSGIESIDYAGALDEALCYGWIDGVRRSLDEVSCVQKFTPRRKSSLWSKRNIEYIDRLTKAGLMMPAGLAEVERAKMDGRWAAAYDKATDMTEPEYLLVELDKRPKAKAFYELLNKTNRFTILWRLQTVKTDKGRQQRLDKILAMLEDGEKFH